MTGKLLPLLCLLIAPTQAFLPFRLGGLLAQTHTEITKNAIYLVAKDACREEVQKRGQDFNEPGLDPNSLYLSCLGVSEDAGPVSGLIFKEKLDEIISENTRIDHELFSSSAYHFNDEVFESARDLIIQGLTVVRASMEQENFKIARQTLGALTHTLQDFYSHTNWLELGNLLPNPNLLLPDKPLGNIADIDTPTCRSCTDSVCPDLILPEILSTNTLTSGYVSFTPKGKCAHGDKIRAGISKDYGSGDMDIGDHDPHLHAAFLAKMATADLLQDLRTVYGNEKFLRMLGITRTTVVCFVIDTTASMRGNIEEMQRLIEEYIDRNAGTPNEPSLYILVEFDDLNFGPVRSTTDPDVMKQFVDNLRIGENKNPPKFTFSALQLALSVAPPSSDIFVFTDSPPLDFELLGTVSLLLEMTKCKMSFFLSKVLGRRRRAAKDPTISLYEQLAQLSGGQTIEVSKGTLSQVTAIIQDSITSSQVTLLQIDSTRPGTFLFLLDSDVQNVTLHITGQSVTFTLQDPSGISQNNTAATGPLGSVTQVGNLLRVSLNAENRTGSWSISIRSPQAYSLRITGRSRLNFTSQFVRRLDGPHPEFSPISARPPAGQNSTIQLTVSSAEMLSELKLGLVSADGEILRNANVADSGGGSFLSSVTQLPDVPFTFMLVGQKAGQPFQRQSSTQIQTSKITVQVQRSVILEPGTSISVPFTVDTTETDSAVTVRVGDDQRFVRTFTASLNVSAAGSANGSLSLSVPVGTPSGSTSHVIIEANATGTSNFALLLATVIQKLTDLTPPVCRVVNESLDCPLSCSNATWEVTLLMSDGNGTGLQDPRISTVCPDQLANRTSFLMTEAVKDENGNNATLLTYRDCCCVRDVEISAVDREGNVGRCVFSIRRPTTNTTNTTTTTTTARSPTIVSDIRTTPSNCPTTTTSRWTMSLLLVFVFALF